MHELRVAHGKLTVIKGVLKTSAGAAMAGAEVVVLQRPTMAGARYLAAAAVVTDHSGAFEYRAPAGSSRMLDFHYRGDGRYKHSDDQVALRVPAAVTIRVNKHSVRNGKTVMFSGRLKGRPYPAKGKVLDLQAFYRGKWRTFATPRANQRGLWKTRYRFQATRGRVNYRFRIRVRTTSDYPYELGYSRTTLVRVHGR